MIYLNDDIEHFDWQAALPLLSEQRREQCLKFKHELGRKTCARPCSNMVSMVSPPSWAIRRYASI